MTRTRLSWSPSRMPSSSRRTRKPDALGFLLTWNPKRYPWKEFDDDLARLVAGKPVGGSWKCRNRQVREGSRLFWYRQGAKGRGIVASGWATSDWYRDDEAMWVDYEIDRLLRPWEMLSAPRDGVLRAIKWGNQFSGLGISSQQLRALEKIWSRHVGGALTGGASKVAHPSGDRDAELEAFEGAVREGFTRHRKREVELRNAKIREVMRSSGGNLRCAVPGCQFDFAKTYGSLGVGYAHVHHLKPLSSRRRESLTRLSELAVVCANCHAMIHLGGQCRPLKGLIRS